MHDTLLRPRIQWFVRPMGVCAAAVTAALATSQAHAAQILSTPRPVYPDLRVAGVIDYDGDGRLEIIGTEARTGKLEAYRTDAFGRPVLVRTLADVGFDLRSVVSADMDGDGTKDLVGIGGSEPTGTIVIFYDRGGDRFEPFVPVGSTHWANQVLATDFDADGRTDLLVYPALERLDDPVEAPDAISFIKNLGGGAFDASLWVMSFPESLRSAAPLDLDLDGDLDFIAVRPAFGTLVVARNTGTTFEVVGVPSSESNIRDLTVGDVSGDGIPDVVTLRTTSPMGGPGTVELYLGVAGGTTSAPIILLSGEQDVALDVSLLDVDGDAALDIVLSKLAGALGTPSLLALAGDGVGGFAAPTSIQVRSGTQTTRSLTGDVNGDGRDDLLQEVERDSLFFDSPASTVAFLGGAGASGLLVTREALLATVVDGRFTTGDLNGDGVVDLVAQRRTSLVGLLGLADSDYFQAPTEFAAAPNRFVPILTADLNQDGNEDVIGVSNVQGGGETVGVLLTSLNILGSEYFPIGVAPGYPVDGFRTADWDNDGDLDVIVDFGSGTSLVWHENQGGGAFSVAQSVDLGMNFETWSAFEMGDFNGDGLLDFAVGTAGFPALATEAEWYQGLGNGVFGPRQVLGPSLGPMAAGDLNGDGVADLVFMDSESGPTTAIVGILGSPSGLVAQSATTLVLDAIDGDRLALERINADSSPDLVLLNEDGSSNAYFATAAGTFDPAPTSLTGTLVSASGQVAAEALFSLVDVGGDGDTDLIVASQQTGVSWRENQSLSSAGDSYCGPAAPNSIGASGRMLALGSNLAPLNNLQLHAVDLPPLVFGFFIASQTATPATPAAGSSGLICLGGQIGRFIGPGEVKNTGFYGSSQIPGAMGLRIDLTSIPSPLGFVSVAPGSTWNFQAWHRDGSATGSTSNFTDAVSVTF